VRLALPPAAAPVPGRTARDRGPRAPPRRDRRLVVRQTRLVELALAAGSTEVEGLAAVDAPMRRLEAIDGHPAHRISRTSTPCQCDQRGGDNQEEDVEHGGVVPGNPPARDRVE